MAHEKHDEQPAGEVKVGTLLPSSTPITAEGVGEVFKATRDFITESVRAEIITVNDPLTQTPVLAIVGAGGGISPLPDTFFDSGLLSPRFRRGTAAMTTLDSFIDHVNRFGDDDTAVFADDNRTSPKLTAVLDYHRADADDGQGQFRHGKHRTTFAFPLSDEWKAWKAKNGVVMSMGDFATFLEDRLADIAGAGDDYTEHVERLVQESGGSDRIATYASLMELARGLHVYESAQVEEAVNLASGEGSIRFSVEHETKTRTGGSVKVPKLFFIAIPIFNKGAFYRIAARLRYRKTADGVKFWFDLYRSDLSFDHAFAEAVTKVDANTNASVFFGAPEA
jgi:hypothetical protein